MDRQHSIDYVAAAGIRVLWNSPRNLMPRNTVSGMSLVEILVAVALLAVISTSVLQFLTVTETTLFDERKKQTTHQRNAAIGEFIHADFQLNTLSDNASSMDYSNAAMPSDLQAGGAIKLVPVFGNTDRFDRLAPKCALLADADIGNRTFTFRQDCHTQNGATIVAIMNDLIAKGVRVILSLDTSGARCVVSRPIVVPTNSFIATATVDDVNCLYQSSGSSQPVSQGAHILFPRFVAYSHSNPADFHLSFIEAAGQPAGGALLQMPEIRAVFASPQSNAITFVDADADMSDAMVHLNLETIRPGGLLWIPNVVGANTQVVNFGQRVGISGPIAEVRQTLALMMYRAPNDWFGEDLLRASLRHGVIRKEGQTRLQLLPNCGGQTCGTAILFEIGTFDNQTGFRTNSYITSVTQCGTETPKQRYGYCGYNNNSNTFTRYDRPDGGYTDYVIAPGDTTRVCTLARHMDAQLPAGTADNTTPGYPNPFVTYSPRARGQKMDAITVYLYEQDLLNGLNTRDSFSLFFNFDTFDQTGGKVYFELNNIEQGRNLDNASDPYVMLDDPSEYSPRIIGSNGARPGTLTAKPEWKRPNDGVVVPLRLPPTGVNPATNRFELRNYAQDPDGDNNSNPTLRLFSSEGIDRWSVRATNMQGDAVIYRDVFLNQMSPLPNTAIQLNISNSMPCSSALIPLNQQPINNGNGGGGGGGMGGGN